MAFRLPRDAQLVRFASSDGLALEGRLTVADRARAVVLCHPHPLSGGSMLTPVILTAEQVFREAGWTTLAFNFRGVGGSAGTHGEGLAELTDVAGALDYVAHALGVVPPMLAVAGYSFGSVVGGRVAATDPRVRFYLGIAPVLNHADFGFLRDARCRIALIAGASDELCDRAKLETLAASLPGAWVRVVESDHFFTGALGDLATACRAAIAWLGPSGHATASP